MTATGDEIAIVGIGCNFPGGEGIDNFWQVLVEGRNCTVEITPERFNTREWYDPDDNKPGKICTTQAALIDEFNTFDNKLFGINDVEAERMDPQQKLLLECTYRALEDAGVAMENISGSKTGVFVGLMNRDYEIISSRAVTEINHYDGTGAAMSIAANRISYTFNLTGPSLSIDTACSSFLFALHYGSQAVKQGDCEAALCGGVNCIIDPRTFVSLSKAKMISPEGMSMPFSKKANGYGRGEGCGVLLLKPLKKALEDHNRIWGVINISAVNQNGRSVTPITRPSQAAQEKLLRSIYLTHVDPSVVQYVEAHGTGTPAGDPTEAESLGSIIGNNRSPKMPDLKIGSVKGNIGHAESAAGAAGLIKVLLMMHHETIVPSLHYREDISSINTKKLNLSIPTTVEKWEESREFGRVAGVNCFGFGGTNAHVVVRQFKQSQVLPSFKRPIELFVLSAASSKSLNLTLEDTAEQLNISNSITLPNLAYTSACRRSHVNYKVLSSLQTDKEYQTLLSLAGNLFELGYNPDWHHFYEGYQGIPAAFPRYQFDRKKLMTYLDIHQQANRRAVNSNHPLIYSLNNDNSEFNCPVSQALIPYLYEHKNNGVALIPGAFFAELGLASVMSSLRPKVPLSTCQISIYFLAPCVLNQNYHVLKIELASQKTVTDFKILSSSVAVYASGQITKKSEAAVEENSISFQDIFQRCKSVVTADKVYETLSQVGFQYGSMFRQLRDVFYCEELKEAITSIKVNRETREEMSDYCIHPVLLDCFLQMTAVMMKITFQTRAGFPSGIGSLVVCRPLEEEMMIYLKTSKSTGNYLEVCGCFTDKHGSVLAELKRVGITFMKPTSPRDNDLLFENKWKEIFPAQTIGRLGEAPRVIVFADRLGIAQQLKRYLHNESRYVMYEDWETLLEAKSSEMTAQHEMKRELEDYQDVLFMWGIQKLNDEFPSKVVAHLAKCCEAYRQIIVALRERKSSCSVRIITYRTTDKNVDHLNPGFALCGMTRTCIVEVSEITFQMIDISSSSTLDISALAEIIVKYEGQDHPEIWINQGRIYTSEIRRTPFKDADYNQPSKSLHNSETFTLYTTDPYQVKDLSAEIANNTITQLENHSVEVQMDKVCIHSEDYFPVSVSSCNFGNTLYWNSYTTDKHKLLALDFSGTVTAVGSEVKKIKVGDQVVSCYPVVASSRVTVPGTVCFNIKKFPCFRNVPCVSYFMVAWEIINRTLPKMKHSGTLGIISTEPESILCKVLTLTAQEMGWGTVLAKPTSDQWQRVNQCNALVYLPPVDGMSKEVLVRLSHLRDLVIVHGNQQSECFRYLIGSDQENIRVHVLKLISVFQKAALKQSLRAVHGWIKSMQMKQLKNLSYSVFQQTENFESTNSAATSYFTCKSIPLAVLKGDVAANRISDIPVYEAQKKMFKQNAVYIVAGGLTGLGFETVKFIAQNGGGCIAILSRSNPSSEKQEEIKALQNQCEGSRIVSLQCNVISSSQVEKALSSIDRIFPKSPIKGVFHSAVVLHDGRLEALNLSHFEKVLSPKVAGVINLHRATRGQELDYFVCYSSVTSFLGNSTQANYAAANSFLDIFCHYRRNCGLSGQSINWGALNLGLLLNQNHIQNILESKGIDILQVHEIYEYLKKSLILNNPQQAVVKLNFGTLSNHVLSRIASLKSRFYTLISEELGSKLHLSEQGTPQNLSPVNSEDYITSLVSHLSSTNVSDFTMNTSLASLGMDSMLAMTLQNRIFHERRVEIPLVKLLDPHTTMSNLVLFLEESSNESGILEKTTHVAENIYYGN
nr:equisetin synthetase eqxS-like [Chrysemys picta bellii]